MKYEQSQRIKARLTSIAQMAVDCISTIEDIENEEGDGNVKQEQLKHAQAYNLACSIDDRIEGLDELLTEISDGDYLE